MKTLLETLPQHDDKVLNELCNALRYCGISIESILKGEEPLAEQEDKTQDENIKASKSAEEKEYKEAYVKARRCGSCRNDFIRIMITGPQNVGKSCLIQAFIRQGLILAVGATTAAVITKELVKLVTYNMDDKSVDDFKAVLARKVITAIETVKRQIREEESYSDSSLNDIESSTPSPLIRLDSTAYASNLVETSPQAMPADEDMIPLDFLENYFRGSSESDQASVIDHCHYGKLWDFAGHSIYHITHQPFLSHNCIYLLVLDMSQDMNNHVVNREGNNTEMTYLEALQEWLASIIGSSKSIARTKAEIDDILEDIAWPMVILVGTHADKLGDEKACQERFEIFKNTILREFPSYADHIYGSGIIFNCNDKDNSEETRLQRQKNCGQLHNILRDFVNHQPFIDRFSQIPLKWYIMAAILHTFPDRFNEEAAKFHTKLNQSVSRIMTAEEIELLAKEYKLCDGIEDIHQMLLYLHDLGEIVYCQKEPVKGKVVTQVEWLLNVFRSIIQLDKPDSKGLAINAEYEVARNTGIMSQHYINDKFDKLGVEEKERKFLLDLMESYDIICKVSKEDDGCPDQYFVPYLFRSNSQEFDCQGFKVSGWLYVGFKPSQMPYIPDGILFCLLVSCYKEWKKSEIEPRYKCAKYRLKEDCYDIVVKKESSYIGIQYRYRMVPNKPQLQLQIEAKVKKSINEKKPYEFLRNKLSSLIKERMPRCEKSDCSYFIKCPSCNLFNPASNPIDGSSDVIFCDCSDVYECGSIHKWVMSSVEDTDDNGRNDAVLRQIDDIEGQKVDIYIVSPDSPASSYINIISKKVGPDWKNLARELDFTNTNIKKISQDNSNDTDQQCVDMLDSHCKLMGETFTKLALVKALFACGLRSVAETILNRDK
ncbi:uncharacterized protein TRIADDRAFT_61412 [Trichoplax adhaerens]|uniref:Death domain-containing protein n=1 Tax=Trichoplax adhaerens TaxID=10228 RepID=B3SAX3_TRIAD|nr:hypothetical protein TRIADDRAFT_61412 [Trichoplax adhaerens]EDV20065.1 hypothetical protein TRIADDRAFT_61412 [Trichoplax adhaerens]|eukprot:XP_002117449.1 hypothetical protein TRIADDRAFT_61412 [Trichoplax adhaerens]